MNGSYYKSPVFINDLERDSNKNNNNDTYEENMIYQQEQSYIENILRNNTGKKVKVYTSFPDSIDYRDKVFEGYIVHAGKDNLIIYDKENDKNYLILMIYLNYVEFTDEITWAK